MFLQSMVGRETRERLVLLMLAAGLWCISHPYVGMIEHDARVYSLLVWHWLSPEAYARDPFFLFGSQDRFSAFTPLYAALANALGLPHAALTVTALGGGLWVATAAVVARGLLDDRRLQALAVLCCAMWSLNYSPNGATFHLNEAFPTARSIAFPLGTLAIGLAILQQFRTAVLVAVVAFALHPLLGLWPLLLILAQRLSDRAILVAAFSAAVLLVAFNFMGLSALQRMDTAWESITRHSSRDIFVGPAGIARINATLAWLSLLFWAGRLGAERARRWYRLGAAIGGAGFLLAQISSYFYPAVLLVQAQLWRAMWVAVFLGVFALAELLGVAWRGAHRIWWAIGGLLLVIAGDWAGFILCGSVALFHPYLRRQAAVIGRRVDSQARRFAPILLIGLVLAVLPGYVQDLSTLGSGLPRDYQSGFPLFDGLFLAGGLGLGVLLLALLVTSGLQPWLALTGSASLLLFAVLHWDQRLEKYRDWESVRGTTSAPMFANVIRPGEVVYWPGSIPQRVWLELGTANYASSDQVIGGVFSREKTFEMLRRRQRLAVASLAESWPVSPAEASLLLDRYRRLTGEKLDETGNLHESYKRPISLTGPGMLYACEDTALDWVISNRALPQNVLPPVSGTGQSGLWLYSCDALRAVLPAPTFMQQPRATNLEKGASR